MYTIRLVSSLPHSWKTFVTTMCNVSHVAMKYSEITSSILTEATWRKLLVHDSASDAYVVQGSADRPNNWGRSSSRSRTNIRRRNKSRDNQTCNYCKKPRHIKADFHALKEKNDKAQQVDQKSGQHEVNYICFSTEVLADDPNILFIEQSIELKFLHMTKESSTWLLNLGASYHMTPHRSQFQQYLDRYFDLVQSKIRSTVR